MENKGKLILEYDLTKINNRIVKEQFTQIINGDFEAIVEILQCAEIEKNKAKNFATKESNENKSLLKENEKLRAEKIETQDIKNNDVDKWKNKYLKSEKEKAELLEKINVLKQTIISDRKEDKITQKSHDEEIKKLNKNIVEKDKEKKLSDEKHEAEKRDMEKKMTKIIFENKTLKNHMSKDTKTSNWSSGSKRYPFKAKVEKEITNSRDAEKDLNVEKRKSGGQIGHKACNGVLAEKPDFIENITNPTVLPNWGIVNKEKNTVTQQTTELVIKTIKTVKVIHFTNGLKVGNMRIVSCANRYGDTLNMFIILAMHLEMNTYNRLPEFISILTDNQIKISQGYINKTVLYFNTLLGDQIEWIKRKIQECKYLNFDETALKMIGANLTVQGFSTKTETLLIPSKKKCDSGIIEFFKSCKYHPVLIVDYCKFYQRYEGKIAQCWAHILRYLKSHEKCFNIEEAKIIAEAAIALNKKRIADFSSITPAVITEFENLIKSNCESVLKIYENLKCADEKKYWKDVKNLFTRMIKHIEQHVAFLTDLNIDFTNNDAERSFRMIKSKLNVSCVFKNINNVEAFLMARSYIQTCKKRKIDLNYAIRSVFQGIDVFSE